MLRVGVCGEQGLIDYRQYVLSLAVMSQASLPEKFEFAFR